MMDFIDVKRTDLNYNYLYGDLYAIMKNAGKAVYDFVKSTFGNDRKICVICGTGNNAGDGIVAAELLRKQNNVVVLLIKGPGSIKTIEAKKALEEYKGKIEGFDSVDKCISESEIIIDAIFGIGISGIPRHPYDEVIGKMNKNPKTIVSVDVPSGLGTQVAVNPSFTVTFTDQKVGMNPKNSGEIIVGDIGFPERVFTHSGPGDLLYYNLPLEDSHKGMNGTLGIVGGWTFYGSAIIAGLGANKIGIDLIKIYSTEINYEILSGYDPSLIIRKIDPLSDSWIDELFLNRAVLVGPGLGLAENYVSSARKIIKMSESPLIIDADGIKAIAGHLDVIKGKNAIITPHKQEFKILSGMEPTEENVKSLSEELGIITVLKGRKDIITDGKKTMYTEGGNARMTMGGTGDLLAGIISALVSRGIDPFRASVMGTFINKRSAELAFEKKAYWYDLSDMMAEIPPIMKKSIL